MVNNESRLTTNSSSFTESKAILGEPFTEKDFIKSQLLCFGPIHTGFTTLAIFCLIVSVAIEPEDSFKGQKLFNVPSILTATFLSFIGGVSLETKSCSFTTPNIALKQLLLKSSCLLCNRLFP